MTLRVRPEVATDILDAARWYDDREAGLGVRLVGEIEAVFQRIDAGPHRFPSYHRGLRRALLRRFPYSVYFAEDEAGLIVYAVLHQRRDFKPLDERLDEQE